jgi:hypothetical protein
VTDIQRQESLRGFNRCIGRHTFEQRQAQSHATRAAEKYTPMNLYSLSHDCFLSILPTVSQ